MKMNKIFAGLIALFLFAGCATQKNAEKYYSKNPNELTRKCAGIFQTPDSIGNPIITITPGNNTDYTSKIDSLSKQAGTLLDQLAKDSIKAASISRDCSNIVSGYQSKVMDLTAKIGALNANYKKPTPDTFRVEVPTFRIPFSYAAQMQVLKNTNDSLGKQLAVIISQRDDHKSASNKKTYIIIGLSLVLGVGIFLKLKNII